MSKETVSKILNLVLIAVLVIGFSYMLRENTRLTVVNHRLESDMKNVRIELVDSQNEAWDYKWQLHQINESNGWGEDQ